MTDLTDAASRRARHHRHLVQAEGVTDKEAEDFLAVLDAAEAENPEFHARFVADLERRIEAHAARADVARGDEAKRVLARLSMARDTRVGPMEPFDLLAVARRALAKASW